MNVCVCEPAAVKEDGVFTAIGGCLVRLYSEGMSSDSYEWYVIAVYYMHSPHRHG